MAATAEKLRGLARPDVVEVGPVPGLDDTVFLRPLGVRARKDYSMPFLQAHLNGTDIDWEWHTRTRMALVLRSLCDADGDRLFDDDDIGVIEDMPMETFDFLAQEIDKLNGFTKEAEHDIAGN